MSHFRSLHVLGVLLGISILLGVALLPGVAWWEARPSHRSALAAGSAVQSVYMPLVAKADPLRSTFFGVEMYNINSNSGLDKIVYAGASWIRRNALLWSHFESNEGQYYWYSQSVLRQELITASTLGIKVILIIRSTPEWAQAVRGVECGRIRNDKLDEFGDFMYEAVKRFSAPPYNVKYWQIWNEPDVVPSAAQLNGINGCWGDPNDPYFGGGYYADVLKAVYPRMKEANPETQVVVGGLLMDCNVREDCPKYLEGILDHHGARDGGDYFDVIAFNAYDYYQGFGEYKNENWSSSWDDEGPVVIAKANYIRGLLAQYGVEGKTLMNTEGALLCGATGGEDYCLTSDFENTKAHYVAQLYAAALAEGLQANVWYNVSGWRGSGLLDTQLNPLPAYNAYAFAWQKLLRVEFNRQVTEYLDVKGYEFKRFDRRIWVLWSRNELSQVISLPAVPLGIWDALGNSIPVTGATLEVSIEPLYIELPLP